MTKHLYNLASRLQEKLLGAGSPDRAPRILLDAWATLFRWNQTGEHVWRVTEAQAEIAIDRVLPLDLPLVTAPVHAAAVAYVLPDAEWIVIARHESGSEIVVRAPEMVYGFRQPLLTYCTEVSGGLAAGYINLIDRPTPAHLALLPGTSLGARGARQLGDSEIAEEDYRFALAINLFYR